MHLGIAGEVRAVISRADGSIKTDTGFQKNLILNQGLDFFGGGKGSHINASCAIGSGNSAPEHNQTKLDSFIALTSATDTTSDYSYVDKGDGLYRIWEQNKYRFTNLDNVNVAEVGLVSNGTSGSNYYLTTRALIKDSGGSPTTITVKLGETLDIYYKIHKVIGVADKTTVVNLKDGDEAETPYNVVTRPIGVGSASNNSIARALYVASYDNREKINFTSEELKAATFAAENNSSYSVNSSVMTLGAYKQGSFKLTMTINAGLNDANIPEGIKSLYLLKTHWVGDNPFPFHPFQVRFGSVADDSPIVKTAKDTLAIPLEVSWGRFEGEL